MMKKALLLLLIFVMFIAVGCSSLPMQSAIKKDNNKVVTTPGRNLFDYSKMSFQDNEVLLKAESIDLLEKMIVKDGAEILKKWPEIGWTLVSVPPGDTVLSFLEKVKDKKGILLAEPNFEYELHSIPSAERYDEQWGFKNINAEKAWEITTGSSDVIVAIVDTGVEINHPEFKDKSFVGAKDIADGGSYDGSNMVDMNGHGTHVTGIAADDGRKGEIAGLAWDCPVMPVRVQDRASSISTSYLTDAMVYLGDYAQNHPDKRIVANMSIGGRSYSFTFKEAIDYAVERGVLLVTSAGNDSKRILSYPSGYNGVVSVTASNPYDEKTSFSTTGWWNSVAAPGIEILSTVNDKSYGKWAGTSMASPFVAGAAALLLSKYPDLTPLEMKNQIEQTARGTGFNEELGYGILDVEALLGTIQPMNYGSLNVTSNIISTSDAGWIGTGVITVFDARNSLVSFGTTDSDGDYVFHALKPGNYKVSLSYHDLILNEYEVISKDVTVQLASNTILDFRLDIPTALSRTEIFTENYIEEDGRIDNIEITISRDGIYEFITDFYQQTCDTVLYVYDSEGNLVVSNDDSENNYPYSYIIKEFTAGEYRVEIVDWQLEDGGISGGLYTNLTVNEVNISY